VEKKKGRSIYNKIYRLKYKEEIKEWKRKNYIINKEDILKKNKGWRLKNKNKVYIYNKKWALKNKEENPKKLLEYSKRYRLKQGKKLKEKQRKYHQLNKERIKKVQKIWDEKNKEKMDKHKKEYRIKNRGKNNLRCVLRRKKDKVFNITCKLRNRLWNAFNQYEKGRRFKSSKYGINYNLIIEHLKPFPKDISKYHIDHIKPLCSFNLLDPKQVKIAFAPENHQWLTAEQNIKKRGSLNWQ